MPTKSKTASHPKGHTRSDDGTAFLPDPYGAKDSKVHSRAGDELAETLAEEFVASATSAEEVSEDVRDALYSEETGGPFVETSGKEEFARDVDESNPADAEREPFPLANSKKN